MKNFIRNAGYFMLVLLILFGFKSDSAEKYSDHNYIHATFFGLSSKDITGTGNRDAILEAFDVTDEVNASGNRRRTVLLPPGKFNIENINFNHDHIHLKGAGMPKQNETKDSIFGGTLLVGGRLNLNGKYGITIEDLGMDVSGVSARDAISSGVSGEGSQSVTIRNVLLKGSGTRHGIVLTSGGDNIVEHVEIDSFDHGVAFRGSNNRLYDFKMIDCKVSSVVSKSIVSGGVDRCYGNIIENGYCLATSLGSGAGIIFDAHGIGSKTYGNSVRAVYLNKVSYGVRVVGDGDVYGNSASDVYMDRPNQAGIYLEGNADNNSFSNISVIDVNGTPFVNAGNGNNNDVNNSYYGNPSSLTDTIGEFRNYTVHEIL